MKLKCPICKEPTDSETTEEFPFCSKRCRIIDLGNWADETYKISTPTYQSEFEEEPPEPHEGQAR